MASSNRQDRAFMRQRGAGSRAVAHADFGLQFGFGLEQHERSRNSGNTDLGRPLPGSARSLRSITRTPQTRRSNSRQPSRTPGRRSREASLARSVRGSSSVQQGHQENRPDAKLSHVEVSGPSIKRRRLSQPAMTPEQPTRANSLGPRTTRSSTRRKTTNEIFTIAEDEDAGERARPVEGEDSLFVPQEPPEMEKEPRKDLDSDQNATFAPSVTDGTAPSTRSPATSLPGVEYAPVVDIEGDVEDISASPHEEAKPGGPERARSRSVPVDQATQQASEKSARVLKKQPKKRKSVVLIGRKKRPSVRGSAITAPEEDSVAEGMSSASSLEPRSSPVSLSAVHSGEAGLGESMALDSEEESLASYREPIREEMVEDGDETYIQESSPEPPTPAPARNTVQRRSRSNGEGTEKPKPGGKKSKPTFPILTHRLTHGSALPTIDEADELETQPDAETDLGVVALGERAQPNAVDVLSQICRETVATMIERLSETTTPSELAALKNKRSAMEAFGRDLDDELFEMSEALENRINLEARVRKSKRDKSALQTEWLEIRKERERIALKCDAVRRSNWKHEEDARQRWRLSEAARRAELELDRDDQVEDDGLEYLLRSVANDASSLSDQGGVLDRVRSFNAQLESMALFLEAKTV